MDYQQKNKSQFKQDSKTSSNKIFYSNKEDKEPIYFNDVSSRKHDWDSFRKPLFYFLAGLTIMIIGSYVTTIALHVMTDYLIERLKLDLGNLEADLEAADFRTYQKNLLLLNSSFKNCPVSGTFHFPNDDQVTDYVKYSNNISAMNEFTVCSWIDTVDSDTILSYAVPSNFNEILIYIRDSNSIHLILAGLRDHIRFRHNQLSGTIIHLCIWFSSLRNETGAVLNGIKSISEPIHSRGIQGGGILILGQEQDVLGGKFEQSQAFSGNITNVIIWPRVLTVQEIFNIAELCVCPNDYVVEINSSNSEIHGNAYHSTPSECPTSSNKSL